ncbi:preprotein translocase subunit SecG [Methylocucumis oryzae]|uniref:Protein-export membrane protein SecG n=1 Tax=Methylocucumis oryzae TaxID=1632867 RepID=A0A0F3ILR6_9GAMM|nr:preprotein translocase subunit SecG [Methylocucumis oryzae]KJV07587.1 hypothetical protein VZ94_03610 [Methylocucumis oryzae]
MYQIIIVIHVLLGLGIIGLILIQHGKGADAGATFGAGASASVFGAQGAGSFLTRTTAIFATLFFMTSLGLSVLNGKKNTNYDLMSQEAEQQSITIPNPVPDKQPETNTLPAQPISEAPVSNAPTATTAPAATSEVQKTEAAQQPAVSSESVAQPASEAKPEQK